MYHDDEKISEWLQITAYNKFYIFAKFKWLDILDSNLKFQANKKKIIILSWEVKITLKKSIFEFSKTKTRKLIFDKFCDFWYIKENILNKNSKWVQNIIH